MEIIPKLILWCFLPGWIATNSETACTDVAMISREHGRSGRGPQEHLDYAVFLVAELLVHLRGILQARRMGHHEAWIDLAGLDLLEQRLGVGLDMSLP